MKRRRIALVTHAIDGGIWATTSFLERVLRRSERYTSDVYVVATSARDVTSVRLNAPATWLAGCQVRDECVDGINYKHVGALLAEFEFQRYQPRRALTDILNQYDLIQVVAGAAAWAGVTGRTPRPVCLFVATTAERERRSLIRQSSGAPKLWRRAMTYITGHIERRALDKVTRVFAESEYTRDLLAGRVAAERLSVSPPGVDIDLFTPASVYCTDGHILAVGRFIDPRKNVRLLFEAYHYVRHRTPGSPRLVIAGASGVSKEDWDYAVSLGLEGCVDIRADVTRQQLLELYQGAALFVLSSDEEGLGIVILEAMASGLPVVSTDCGGPATAVHHAITGYLTPVGDSAALARAIEDLLSEPGLRERMGRAGRALAETRFSLSAAGKVYLDTYDELLAG